MNPSIVAALGKKYKLLRKDDECEVWDQATGTKKPRREERAGGQAGMLFRTRGNAK